MTRAEAYGFVQWLGDNYKPGVAIRVRSLRAYYGWLLQEELIVKNPFKGITVSVPSEAKLTPSEDEIDAMLAKAKGHRRDHAVLILLVDIVDELVAARTHRHRSPLDQLTSRELEILSEIATGKSNAAIATTLFVSERAVEKHSNSIFFKLGLSEEREINRRVKAVLLYLAAERGVTE